MSLFPVETRILFLFLHQGCLAYRRNRSLRMFPPALLHFPNCLKVTPSYAAVCRREDASGSFWHLRPVETCLMRTPWDKPGLTDLQRQVFRGLLVCSLCVGRAALDTRRHGSSLPRLYRMQPTPLGFGGVGFRYLH